MSVPIIVSINRDFPMEDVVARLVEGGMTIDRRLHRIRIVTGNARIDLLDELETIPGVADVEIDRPVTAAEPATRPDGR